MADVTGPISSLPGSRHEPKGNCDTHADRPAIARVQGETDSFGCEMHDMCAECLKEYKEQTGGFGRCDWCKTPEVKLRPRRDADEGLYGPVYQVCSECIKKNEEAITKELADDSWDD